MENFWFTSSINKQQLYIIRRYTITTDCMETTILSKKRQKMVSAIKMWIFLTCDTKKTRQKIFQKRTKKIWVTIFFPKSTSKDKKLKLSKISKLSRLNLENFTRHQTQKIENDFLHRNQCKLSVLFMYKPSLILILVPKSN